MSCITYLTISVSTCRARKLRSDRQIQALSVCYQMFSDDGAYPNQLIRVAALDRVCVPLLQRADKATVTEFFRQNLLSIKQKITARESRVSLSVCPLLSLPLLIRL